MDYNAWAEWYDVLHAAAPTGEVEFYVAQAKQAGGSVLEIGVGTGRIAIAVAQAGVDVTGIDLEEAMLAKAREKLAEAGPLPGKVEFLQRDMRDFDLGRTFPLVTLPGRTLLLLRSPADQWKALKRAAAHLAPGGKLAFNVFNPTPELLSESSDEPFVMGQTVNPATGRRCRLLAVNHFDTVKQRNDGLQIVEELDGRGKVLRRVELEVKVRFIYASEMHTLLRSAGLRASEVYGDFQGSPLSERSDELVFVATLLTP